MQQKLAAGGYLDLLTKSEVTESMGHSLDDAVVKWYRGIDYLGFMGGTGNPAPNIFTIPDAPESGYAWSVKLIAVQLSGTPAAPTVSTPAVPASGANVQNPNAFPVNVTITGGTLTNVTVNGVTVGTTDGTYLVPSGGTISVTYTVAPTWQWTVPAGVNTPVPVLSAYLGSTNTVAPFKSSAATLNGSLYEAFLTWSSEQVVIKDGRQITLSCATLPITNFLLMVKQVPIEMQGKL